MTRLSLQFDVLATERSAMLTHLPNKLREIAALQKDHKLTLVKLEDRIDVQLQKADNMITNLQSLDYNTKQLQYSIEQGFHRLPEKIEHFPERASDLSDMSKGQYEEIRSKLDSLILDIQMIKNQENGTQVPQSALARGSNDAFISEDIQHAVKKLCSYLDGVQQSLYNEEAESLVKDLAKIFQLLLENSKEQQSFSSVGACLSDKDLDLLRHKLTSSSHAAINGKGTSEMISIMFITNAVFSLQPKPEVVWGLQAHRHHQTISHTLGLYANISTKR